MTDHTQTVWEQRWNPLRGEWVLFSSHRGGRPWIGDRHAGTEERPLAYDPDCALCPGNERLHGHRNDAYEGVYWFTNDLPCFGEQADISAGDSLYATKAALGTAEVVCYHPDHGKVFAQLTDEEAAAVVRLWRERTVELGKRPDVDHVLIFENKGSLVGTSNPHPHCQIYAGNMIYAHTVKHVEQSRKWKERTGRHLGLEILQREIDAGRVICENEDFVACVPWFARYVYEVYIFPRHATSSLADLTPEQCASLGSLQRDVCIRLDNLWQQPMPYVMTIHQAPTDGQDYSMFPFHVIYHPPLRKPDTMKYLAGPEVGGGSMTNESDPDVKAAELRAVSSTHYTREHHE
ncbi:MAG: galactose-1-phosphate uridylyltransferase [Puniceicoccaceae bacterium]